MLSAVARFCRVPRRAHLISRRVSSNVGNTGSKPADTVIGLTSFMIAFLVPSGYILSNLEEYKKRD